MIDVHDKRRAPDRKLKPGHVNARPHQDRAARQAAPVVARGGNARRVYSRRARILHADAHTDPRTAGPVVPMSYCVRRGQCAILADVGGAWSPLIACGTQVPHRQHH